MTILQGNLYKSMENAISQILDAVQEAPKYIYTYDSQIWLAYPEQPKFNSINVGIGAEANTIAISQMPKDLKGLVVELEA